MKIIKATSKDIKTVLKFQNLLNKYESKFAKFKINKNKTAKALTDKNVAYFIAYSKEKPVGCAEVYIQGKAAIMSGTFILPKFREKGIAKTLFNARKNWAKNKVKELKLKVYTKNKRAILVWNKLGYKTTSKGKLTTMVYKLKNRLHPYSKLELL